MISQFFMDAAMFVAAIGILLAGYRLVMGPRAGSRAVALDVLTQITMPLIAYLAIRDGRGIYLDVALVYGILSFLGVMSLARYVERGL